MEMFEEAPQKGRRAVFLDRDGTLNVERNYLYRPDEFEWVPGAIAAIRRINALGFLAIIVTNQSGVARGFYSAEDVDLLHRHVDKLLAGAGAWIDGYYICPHHPLFGDHRVCGCRKPEPGMLLQAATEFSIDLTGSFLVGDKASDVEAAMRANVTPILVRTGYGTRQRKEVPATTLFMADLSAAVDYIAERVA